MRSHTPRDLHGLCARCFLKAQWCLCSSLPRLRTNTEVVVVRHVSEEWLTSNTARLATLMLGNLRILPYGGGEPFDARPLVGENTLLLTPDASALPLERPPQRLILLDGTFRQARRMYKKIPELHSLQTYAIESSAPRLPGLRRPPRADGLSTIEAIAFALARFESPQLAEPLLGAYAEFVRRAELARGHRQPGSPERRQSDELRRACR